MADSITIETKKQLRGLLTKKPFTRILPDGHYDHGYVWNEVTDIPITRDSLKRKIVTQEDFLRELDPAGHIINDKELYPDIWQQNEEDNMWYIQEIPRYAFAFQRVILIKHLTHLCGNDIQFELADRNVDDETLEVYYAHRNGWAEKNMEIAWYQLAKSVKATGDGAFVGYLDDGKFGWKVLSFLNGDRLYPHYDMRTGRLNLFARTYCNYDEEGVVSKRYIDVWDDKYYYRYVADGDPTNIVERAKQLIFKFFSVDGYKLEEQVEHRFDKIPVAYMRDDSGPCWTYSEEAIENYEVAFSNLAHSNHEFGLPIMYIKGEGSQEITTKDMTFASKIMVLPEDGEIGFMNRNDASNAYKAELGSLEDNIYRMSHAVKAPELKSGDTPGVALKIMYSDAYEMAMNDAQEYDGCIDDMISIFNWGYGIEVNMRLAFINTKIRHYIEPYIHVNNSELVSNLNTSVVGGFLSKQTASEKNPYSVPNEWQRIQREKHDEAMQQLLLEEQKLETQADINVEQQEELAGIQTDAKIEQMKAEAGLENGDEPKRSGKRKFSVATAHGQGKRGRPDKLSKTFDENRNEIDPLTGKAKSKWNR